MSGLRRERWYVPRGFTFLLVLQLAGSHYAADPEKFCEENLTPKEGAYLHFSRDMNEEDYGHLGGYKTLHCCVYNYDTIEWYKDGKQLQGHSSFTKMVCNNQTIVSTVVMSSDKGMYSCIARSKNESEPLIHNIIFKVNENERYSKEPLWTKPPKDAWALEGGSASFMCEAFKGSVGGDKDASYLTSQIIWKRKGADNVFAHQYPNHKMRSNVKIKDEIRSKGTVEGKLLIIDPVLPEDFTQYTCFITANNYTNQTTVTLHHGENPHTKVSTSYKETLVVLAVFTFLLILIVTMVIRWHVELRLFWKDRFCKLEEHDERQYDVFVCYDEADASFVLEILVPFLEKCQYRCFAWERDSLAGEWITDIYVQSVQKSRRFLLVLSQALLHNPWCTFALYVAVDAMLKQHSRVICILLQEIDWSEVKLNDDQKNLTLRQVLRIVRNVHWEPGGGLGSHRFWKQLRLYLPPRRNISLHVPIPQSISDEFSSPSNPSTPTDDSSSKVALLSVNISSTIKC